MANQNMLAVLQRGYEREEREAKEYENMLITRNEDFRKEQLERALGSLDKLSNAIAKFAETPRITNIYNNFIIIGSDENLDEVVDKIKSIFNQ